VGEIAVPWANVTEFDVTASLQLAPNGDLWVPGAQFVARLPAGSTVWQTIPMSASLGQAGNVVVDGSNTAYFTMGKGGGMPYEGAANNAIPTYVYKIAPGSSTAVKINAIVSMTRQCNGITIDAMGRLVIGCSYGYADGTPQGIYRSTP
jgi:hypothetical protein